MASFLDPAITKNMRDGTLTISDGTGTPETITCTMIEGDFTWELKKNVFPVYDRGVFSHLRAGNEEILVWSFSFKYTGLGAISAADPTVWEALTKTGEAAAWISTSASNSDVYTVDLMMVYTNVKDDADEEITIDNAAIQSISPSEGDEFNIITCSGIAGAIFPTISGNTATP